MINKRLRSSIDLDFFIQNTRVLMAQEIKILEELDNNGWEGDQTSKLKLLNAIF